LARDGMGAEVIPGINKRPKHEQHDETYEEEIENAPAKRKFQN